MSLLVKYISSSYADSQCRIALGKGRFALVDPEDFERLNKYHWYLKMSSACWYAVRKKWVNGKCTTVRMHREIMFTPDNMDCHHIWSYSLDNRKAHLLNVTPQHHKEIHKTKLYYGKQQGTPSELH